MVAEIIKKLSPDQIGYIQTLSFCYHRDNNLTAIRKYLNTLKGVEILTDTETYELELWLTEADRSTDDYFYLKKLGKTEPKEIRKMTVRGILNKLRLGRSNVAVLLVDRAGNERSLSKAEILVPSRIGEDGELTFGSFSISDSILRIYTK